MVLSLTSSPGLGSLSLVDDWLSYMFKFNACKPNITDKEECLEEEKAQKIIAILDKFKADIILILVFFVLDYTDFSQIQRWADNNLPKDWRWAPRLSLSLFLGSNVNRASLMYMHAIIKWNPCRWFSAWPLIHYGPICFLCCFLAQKGPSSAK